jgi:hypothetical protein
MTQKKYTDPTTKSAIALSLLLIGLATLFFSLGKITEYTYLAFIVCGCLLSIALYRINDITELAFTKGASVKLKKAEEISEQVALLAEQMLALFERKSIDENEPFDEKAHEAHMDEIMEKIRSLTRR